SIAARAADLIPAGTPVVTYCWGPGCNGATRAALEFARLGYPVREMIGGFEYWAREGFAVETDAGVRPGRPDELTTVVAAVRADCCPGRAPRGGAPPAGAPPGGGSVPPGAYPVLAAGAAI